MTGPYETKEISFLYERKLFLEEVLVLKKKTRNGMNYVGSINRRLSSNGVEKDCPVNVDDAVHGFLSGASTYLLNRSNALLKVDDLTMNVEYDSVEGRQEYEVQVEQVSAFELLRSSYSLLSAICGPLAANLVSLRCACQVVVHPAQVEVFFESATVGARPVSVKVPNTSEFDPGQLERIVRGSHDYVKNVLTGEYYEQNV